MVERVKFQPGWLYEAIVDARKSFPDMPPWCRLTDDEMKTLKSILNSTK